MGIVEIDFLSCWIWIKTKVGKLIIVNTYSNTTKEGFENHFPQIGIIYTVENYTLHIFGGAFFTFDPAIVFRHNCIRRIVVQRIRYAAISIFGKYVVSTVWLVIAQINDSFLLKCNAPNISSNLVSNYVDVHSRCRGRHQVNATSS